MATSQKMQPIKIRAHFFFLNLEIWKYFSRKREYNNIPFLGLYFSFWQNSTPKKNVG
jgi:hypothetical protein